MLLAQGGEAPLLGDGVDVGADDERHKVEEGDPHVFGQELLGKGQAERARDPADFHHLPEADPDGRPDLVEVPSTGDQGHGHEVDGVLDRSDLERGSKVMVLSARAACLPWVSGIGGGDLRSDC